MEACTEATGDPSSCRNAFAEAQKQAADAAPKYASKEACEKDYKPEQCVQQHTSDAAVDLVAPAAIERCALAHGWRETRRDDAPSEKLAARPSIQSSLVGVRKQARLTLAPARR